MTILWLNANISSTRLDGTPVYSNRRVQLDDDPASERLRTGSAPTLQKVIYDLGGTDYQRGDIITVLILDGVVPPPNPYHVWRMQPWGAPGPANEVALVRLDMLMSACTYWPIIDERTPGMTRTATWNQDRGQPTSLTDPTFGSAKQVGSQQGYLAKQTVALGVMETATQQEIGEAGLFVFERLMIFYEPPLVLKRKDLVALPDGRRGEVSDVVAVHQQNGVTFATMAQLDIEVDLTSIIYQIP